MNLNKRQLLRKMAIVGSAGLAGCTALAGKSEDSGQTDSPTDPPETTSISPTPTQEAPSLSSSRTATDVPTTSTPEQTTPTATKERALPFQFDTDVSAAEPTAETPPIIQIQISNVDEESHALMTLGDEFPINHQNTEVGHQKMQMIPQSEIDDVVYSNTDPNCWKSSEIPKVAVRRRELICPDNTLTGKYAILPVAEESEKLSPCWKPGMYRFSHPYWVDPDGADPDTGDRFEWELTLKITDQPAISIVSSKIRLE